MCWWLFFLPVLEYCMLLGAGWVINRDISNSSLSPQQIGTLSVNVHDWKSLIILKRVQSPSALRNPSLRRLVVLDHHSPKCVCVFCECPWKFEVWLLFHSRSSACLITLFFWPPQVSLLVFFTSLAIFPASLILLLSFSLLRGKSISLPMPLPTALSLPWSIRFPPTPSVLWLLISSSSLVAASSMLIPFLWHIFREYLHSYIFE